MKKRKDMVALGEEIRKQYDTSFCKLQSSGRMPACVKAREVMFWIAAKELGFSEAGDALYLWRLIIIVVYFVAQLILFKNPRNQRIQGS